MRVTVQGELWDLNYEVWENTKEWIFFIIHNS